MDHLEEKRWLEVQFYYICSDILALRNNIMDVMEMIDNLAIFGGYIPDQVKPIAQEVLSSIRVRPSREEFCILCRKFKVQINKIKQRARIHNRTLYQIFEEHEKNPRIFYPRLQPEQLEIVKQFVDSFNKVRGVGL